MENRLIFLYLIVWSDAGVEKGSQASYWIPVQACREISLGKSGGVNSET